MSTVAGAGVGDRALDEAPRTFQAPTRTQALDVLYFTNRILKKAAADSPPLDDSPDYYDRFFGYEVGDRQVVGFATVRHPTRRVRGSGDDSQSVDNPIKNFVIDGLSYSQQEDHFVAEIARRRGDKHRRALIYVHGFNTDFSTAIVNAARIQLDTDNNDVVAFSWPGDLPQSNFLMLRTTYRHAQEQERLSVPNLRQALRLVDNAMGDKTNVLAHSMGAQLLFDALEASKDETNAAADHLIAKHVFLAAPDIDLKLFTRRGRWWSDEVSDTLVFCNASDFALWGSGPTSGTRRLGSCINPARNVSGVSMKYVPGITGFVRHGYFVNSLLVLDDIQKGTKD